MKNYKNAFNVLNFVVYVKIKHIVPNAFMEDLFQSIFFYAIVKWGHMKMQIKNVQNVQMLFLTVFNVQIIQFVKIVRLIIL